MTTTPAAREPKGTPTGGQFAATEHAEPTTTLKPFYDQLERVENTPLDELSGEDMKYLVFAEISHNLSPVVGWAQYAFSKGDAEAHERALEAWKPRAELVGENISKKLFSEKPLDEYGLPRIKGFTADEVEAKLQDEQHQDQCGCDLPDNVCYTDGPEWRARTHVANVHAVFEALTEMSKPDAEGQRTYRRGF